MLLYASLSVADGLGKGFVVPTARTYLVRLQRFSALQNPLNDLFLTHLIRTWKGKKNPIGDQLSQNKHLSHVSSTTISSFMEGFSEALGQRFRVEKSLSPGE